MNNSKKSILLKLLTGALAAMLVFAAFATADTAERDAYKAEVEPICKTNKEESERDLKGVSKLVKENKLKPAGVAFSKAASALEKAQKQLAAVPQPPSDAAKLGKWLSEIKAEVSLMRTISSKFKAGNKAKATSLVVRLEKNATKANNQVIVFGFNYCKIDPSKYRS